MSIVRRVKHFDAKGARVGEPYVKDSLKGHYDEANCLVLSTEPHIKGERLGVKEER